MSNYSILVNTCDSYKDAWPMFFHLLKANWPGKVPPIYLNTESLSFQFDDLDIIPVHASGDIPWGKRLLHALSQIPGDFVLMMLEDFYYENTIQAQIIEQCVDRMKKDESIYAFQLVPCSEVTQGNYLKNHEDYPGFVKRKRAVTFKIIAGPTLWRKTDLIRLTNAKDNPWEWEYFGSFRTWLYKKKAYCWKSKTDTIFDYDAVHGGAIHRGKWVGYKLKELENKYNFKIDYGKREIEEDWMKSTNQNKPKPAYKRIKSIVHNRYKKIAEIVTGLFLNIRKL